MSNTVVDCFVEGDGTSEKPEQEPRFKLPDCSVFPGELAAFFDKPVCDLIFNPGFEDQIRIILSRQKEFNSLRAEFAEELYSKFIIPESCLEKNEKDFVTRYYDIYINDIRLARIKLYGYQATYRAITFSDYKLLLIALKFPHAEWIRPHQGANKWIDFTSAFTFHQINYKFYNTSTEYSIYITTERM